MKVVILAGGLGTRISEHTQFTPKPMIKLNNKPIVHHIIDIYNSFGLNDFIIATGYKSESIEKYFKKKNINNCRIKVVNTGKNTLTGSRLLKLKKYLTKTFMLTYGDGLANIDIKKLINFHKKHKKIITVTSVHPPARFGELKLKQNQVNSFVEKPQLNRGWINGGFFVIDPKFFNFIPKKNVMLEREPMQNCIKKKQLMAFKHEKFWYCIDTKRDLDMMRFKIKKEKKLPWHFN